MIENDPRSRACVSEQVGQDGAREFIINSEVERPLLLQALDLARYVESQPDKDVDLVAIPAERYELAPIHLQANLFEARELLLSEGADAL